MPEGIRELVHCKHKLALGSAAFLHAGVEGLGLDGRGTGGGLGEVGNCQTGIGGCAPAVPWVGINKNGIVEDGRSWATNLSANPYNICAMALFSAKRPNIAVDRSRSNAQSRSVMFRQVQVMN